MKKWYEQHKRLFFGSISALFLVAVIVVLAMSWKSEVPSRAVSGAVKEKKEERVKQQQAPEKQQEDSLEKYVQGIHDLYIVQNVKDIDWTKKIKYDKDKVKKVTAEDKKVNLNKKGEYTLSYRITWADSKKEDTIQEIKVKVVTEEEALVLAKKGTEVWTTKNEVVKAEDQEEEPKETEVAKAEDQKKKEEKEPGKTSDQKSSGQESSDKAVPESSNTNRPSSGNTPSKPSGNTNGGSNTSSGAGSSGSSSPGNNKPVEKPQVETKPAEKPKEPVWHPPVIEKKWVVDKPAWVETVNEPIYTDVCKSICNGCGADITGNPWDHIENQLLSGNTACGGYHAVYERVQTGTNTYTVNHEEEGHWEDQVVKEGYWE